MWLSPSESKKSLRLSLVLTGPGIGEELPPTPKEGDIEVGMRRSDSFKFNRYPVSGRSYGTLTVKVGDKAYSAKMPASLYKYTHGTAQRDHRRRMREP